MRLEGLQAKRDGADECCRNQRQTTLRKLPPTMYLETSQFPASPPAQIVDRRSLLARFSDPRLTCLLIGVVLLLAIWATAAVLVRNSYRTADEAAVATSRELAQTYEAHVLRAIREIDHTLRTVEYACDLVGERNALSRLRERDLLPPELLFGVSIADEHGAVISSTRDELHGDVMKEDFFRRVRKQDDLYIARPRRSPATGDWSLVFSRRMDRTDGTFAGAVFITVDAAYFVSSYDAQVLGSKGLLALVGADGIVRVRRVGDYVESGKAPESDELLAYLAREEHSTAEPVALFDDVHRYLSSRRLTGFPISVLVGISHEEQLNTIRRRALEYATIASLMSLLVASVLAAFGRMSWKLARIRAREQQTRLTAARESGMAEIATNVLHNVGNALTSVNVSATIVSDALRRSKAAGLTRAVDLIRQHEADLPAFLASERGRNLPAYLYQLDKVLQEDQASCSVHLNTLQASIDHIKKIVMMQQMLAKPSAVREEVELVELMEASLQMNIDALGRHNVEVIREFEEVPTVVLDKHGVVQILVNLISNAKHACSESRRHDRQIRLGIRRRADSIDLSVSDNGIGIAPENLTRIFQHGFTTRSTGHGFGLHSSALTARDLGGSLRAHSEGVGKGATFTLTLRSEIAKAAA
jgi:two-component system, NtrC family, sensor kinase